MKIILFIPTLSNGGAQKQLILNYLSLKKNHNDVKILTIYNKNQNPYLNYIIKEDLITLNKKSGKVFNFFLLGKIKNEIKGADLVHAYLAHAIYLACLTKYIFNIQTVIIGGIRTNIKTSDSFDTIIWNGLNKFIFNIIDRLGSVSTFITPSEVTKYSINNWVKLTPILVIKNIFLESTNNDKLNKNSKLNIISSGRICDQKDQIFLIKAFNKIKDIDFSLTIYGSSSDNLYFQRFESILKKINNSNINYKGIYNEPAELFFAKFDALVLTSKYEGFPNVVIEALSSGISVLLPEGIIDGDILGSLVYTYTLGDYDSFKNSFVLLKNDLQLNCSKSKNAYKILSSEFSTIDNSYKEHMICYKSFLINNLHQ
jgi:glycosyltransferase involved in cell wall biosynthesis